MECDNSVKDYDSSGCNFYAIFQVCLQELGFSEDRSTALDARALVLYLISVLKERNINLFAFKFLIQTLTSIDQCSSIDF